MELFLSKLLPLLVMPLGLSLSGFILAGMLLSAGRRLLGGFLFTLAVAVLWAASTPMIAYQSILSLERSYRPLTADTAPVADAVVVLGGAIGAPLAPRVEPDLSDAADRLLMAARLFRAGKAPLVVVAGGSIPWLGGGDEAESVYMTDLLLEWGVPRGAIIQEKESQNTRENAMQVRHLMEERRLGQVLLVTSAMHMRRALGTFRALGVDVVPVPVDYHGVRGRERTVLDWLANADALRDTTQVAREYLGILVYRWREWM